MRATPQAVCLSRRALPTRHHHRRLFERVFDCWLRPAAPPPCWLTVRSALGFCLPRCLPTAPAPPPPDLSLAVAAPPARPAGLVPAPRRPTSCGDGEVSSRRATSTPTTMTLRRVADLERRAGALAADAAGLLVDVPPVVHQVFVADQAVDQVRAGAG